MKPKLKRKVLALLRAAIAEYDGDPEHNFPAFATVGLVTCINGLPSIDSKAYAWLAERLCVSSDEREPSNTDISEWLMENHPTVISEVFRVANRQGDTWARVYNRAWLCKLYRDVAGEDYAR